MLGESGAVSNQHLSCLEVQVASILFYINELQVINSLGWMPDSVHREGQVLSIEDAHYLRPCIVQNKSTPQALCGPPY